MLTSYSHTRSVCNGNRKVGRCCSFESRPLKEGCHWNVHKGKILEDLQMTDAVVKVPAGLDPICAASEVAAEVKKFNFAVMHCSSVKNVEFVPAFHSEIDKVGKGYKLTRKNKNKGLCKDTSVVIQDFVSGQVKDLFNIERTRRQIPSAEAESDSLLKVIQESYKRSNGMCVISAMRGVEVSDNNGNITYLVTSLTIHSRQQEYGRKDMGVLGVEMYENLTYRHLQPSAPLSELPEEHHGHHADLPGYQTSAFLAMNVENVPAAVNRQFGRAPQPNNSSLCTSQDSIDGGLDEVTQQLVRLLEVCPSFRDMLSENCLNRVMGPPPSYSS